MTAPTLARQRCRIHVEREAAARCPSCGEFFCRECVTEHAGRLLCAACWRAELGSRQRRPAGGSGFWRGAVRAAGRAAQLAAGLALAWLFFQQIGRQLGSLPEEFHVTGLWQGAGNDE